jgi:membrane fusion protein (multidrug efflux system)
MKSQRDAGHRAGCAGPSTAFAFVGRQVASAAVVLATALSVVACGGEDAAEPTSEALRPPVMVVPSERRDVVDRIRATGQMIAQSEATIAAQVAGPVTEVDAEEGDAVEKDAILLVIDPERRRLELANAEARLAEARAELDVAGRNYQRTLRLSKGNVASEARLDEDRTRQSLARSAVAAAEAQVGLARRALADATVRAPFAGLVARRHVSAGEYLAVGAPLFDLVALDPIEIEFTVSEIDSAKVAIDDPVAISLTPYPDETFHARVTMISPTLDPRTRTLRVKAVLPNPDGRIRPGLFAHVDLGLSERPDAVVVPEDAIVQRADGSVLFRVGADDRAERVAVETGVLLDGWVEIRDGIRPGDRIVVRGHQQLEDGEPVSVRDAEGRPVPTSVAEPGPARPTANELAAEQIP